MPNRVRPHMLVRVAKAQTRFVCNSCGGVQSRWLGKCPDCGQWDALEEYREEAGATKDTQRGAAGLANDAAPKAMPIHERRGTVLATRWVE